MWKGTVLKNGYAQIYREGKSVRIHRISFEMFTGKPIPFGLDVLHRCGQRLCVNPKHLYLGTDVENMRDRDRDGHTGRGENHARARLTARTVRFIRRGVRAGMTRKKLAARFGVCRQHIDSIVNEKRWKVYR